MLLNLILSILPVAAGGTVAALTSGGRITEYLDIPDFLGVVLVFAVCIFISGYGKSFCRIFSGKKKYAQLGLEELQKTYFALELAGKILLYSALLLPVFDLIILFRNTGYGSELMHSLGPNTAVLFLVFVYICMFEMIICTLKSKCRNSIIMYMAETEEAEGTVRGLSKMSVLKLIIGLVLLGVICYFYIMCMGGFSWNKYSPFGLVLDMPFIVCFLLFTIPLIAVSGNFKNLLNAYKAVFSKRKLNVTRKNLYLNAVNTNQTLNWYAGIVISMTGWIAMMNNLEDASQLLPNLAVSLIPVFYAVLFNLVLLIVETRINKFAE